MGRDVPLLDIEVLLLVPVPMIGRDEIVFVGGHVFPLRGILYHLDLAHGTAFGWEQPCCCSCAAIDCQGLVLRCEAAFDIGRHFGVCRDLGVGLGSREQGGGRNGGSQALKLPRTNSIVYQREFDNGLCDLDMVPLLDKTTWFHISMSVSII